MPTYMAQVKDASGKLAREKIEAASVAQARMFLKNKYSAVGKIKKVGFDIDLSELEVALNSVTVKDKAIFSRQFAVMINAGVAIVRCLGILTEQCKNPKFKKSLSAINTEVQQGTNLSEAMSKHPQCFDRLYVSMVEAGETGGVLDEVLNRLAKLLEDMARLQNQIKSAMTYPTAVLFFAILVFVGMTVFLIPIFAAIFEDLGTTLPALTQFMLEVSSVMRSAKSLILLGAIVVIATLIGWYYKTPLGRVQIDGLLLKVPLFGDLNEKSAVARFCRVFGTLTRSGVPILNSLDIVGDTIGNQVLANAVTSAKEEIKQGGMLSLALQRQKVFPPMALQMITIGEETGELDAMLMKVADFYEDEVEQAVKALTSLIEPLMMVVIGGMVAVILLAMYLPMFEVFNELG